MAKPTSQKLVKLDGRTGEGGGQFGKRNGGLKSQHVSAIKWLAKITSAETSGCFVGSKTIEFKPSSSHHYTVDRDINIDANSASSILLVLQAILPVLLFANNAAALPIRLSIKGGTNGSFSLSYEYLDQVLLPTLERFGIYVERQLKVRGWSHGPLKLGHAEFKIHPTPLGQSLKVPNWPTERGSVKEIDISILVLETLQEPLETSLATHIKQRFPEAKINIVLRENTHRIYTLLVAHTSTGLRFGRDWLYDRKTKDRTPEDISADIAEKVVEDLNAEFEKGGLVDEYLQDQLVIFQALADGRSTILGHELSPDLKSRPDRTDEPFGDGSKHTTTARWVANQMLPHLKWYDNGQTCEGVGWKINASNSTVPPNDS
ncbi:similar to RNA 3'-terminal phosphate cyclase [Botrytis cinerea T4]|uniref:Similar to RNA 3'-terminal phosphate cyclase n=1 Tax=Botryotinia fuckeliana (strain T4) TaxID=999810 RepID=G2YR02_BOTF4|nr:similar to RNA 3'-terminal phosphate cyclase [Botrytis cinerea T4]